MRFLVLWLCFLPCLPHFRHTLLPRAWIMRFSKPQRISQAMSLSCVSFWYGCPHCYVLEPHMQKWAKTRPADVAFFQTPAAMNPVWEVNARGFYAVQEIGMLEKPMKPYLMPFTKRAKNHTTQIRWQTGTPAKAWTKPNLTVFTILLP